MAVLGLLSLILLYIILHMIDFALIYSIFIYIQFLMAPLLTAIGYLFYVIRFSIPYIFVYILIKLE